MWASIHCPSFKEAVQLYQKGNEVVNDCKLAQTHFFCRERLRRSAILPLAMNDPISLQIYADSKGNATGSLFLDDGLTYDYRKKDAYVLGKFVYFKRSLYYTLENGTANSTSSWLERVTIYWFASKPNRIFAQNELKDSKEVQLAFKYDSKQKILVIRKPALPLAQNWQIKITWVIAVISHIGKWKTFEFILVDRADQFRVCWCEQSFLSSKTMVKVGHIAFWVLKK